MLNRRIFHVKKNALIKIPYPRLLLTYWDQSPMSYLNLMTFISFHKHNPYWRILCFVPHETTKSNTLSTSEQKKKYTGKDYFDELKQLDYVCIKEIDTEEFGLDIDIPEVIKSDYIRYYLLNKYGGVWSDLNILYIKPIDKFLVNCGDSMVVKCENAEGDKYYPSGFFGGKYNSQFFSDILDISMSYINTKNYKSIDAKMLTDYLKSNANKYKSLTVLDQEVYLKFDWTQINTLFRENSSKDYDLDQYLKNAVGIHWFNESDRAEEYQNKLDIEMNNASIISYYLKKYHSIV
jgi:hypothetical protein